MDTCFGQNAHEMQQDLAGLRDGFRFAIEDVH